MRIATWNVNSLKARLEKLAWWLERARPDVVLLQETKSTDAEAPTLALREHGYELAHHGEGRWNGVAIASRAGIADVVTNFGEPLRSAVTAEAGDDEPFAEARMIAATRRSSIRLVLARSAPPPWLAARTRMGPAPWSLITPHFTPYLASGERSVAANLCWPPPLVAGCRPPVTHARGGPFAPDSAASCAPAGRFGLPNVHQVRDRRECLCPSECLSPSA